MCEMRNASERIRLRLIQLSGVLGLDLRYFIGGGLWLLLPFTVNNLLGIIRTIFFARLLEQEVYGQFTFVNATVGTLAILTLPGISTALVETVARGNWGSMIDAARARALWGSLGTLAMTSLSLYFYSQGQYQLVIAMLISGVFLPFVSAFQVVQPYHSGRKQFKMVGLIRTGIVILSTSLLLLVLWLGGGLIWLVLVDSASKLIFYFTFFLFAKSEVLDSPHDPEVVSYGRALTGAQAIGSIAAYLDSVILGFTAGFVDVAIYRIASVFPNNYKSLTKMLSTLSLPKLAEHPNKRVYTQQTRRQLFYLLAINLTFVIVIIAIIQFIIPILYGEHYKSSVIYAQLLMLSFIFGLPNSFFVAALQARKQTRAIAHANLIFGGLQIGALLIFVPILGIMGIVLSRIISRWSSAIYRWNAVSKI